MKDDWTVLEFFMDGKYNVLDSYNGITKIDKFDCPLVAMRHASGRRAHYLALDDIGKRIGVDHQYELYRYRISFGFTPGDSPVKPHWVVDSISRTTHYFDTAIEASDKHKELMNYYDGIQLGTNGDNDE